jgi:nitroreductase
MMTPLDKLINGRRSIRTYKQAPPPEEWIEKMILAAMKAPSPSNSQPVRFIRLRSPKCKIHLHQAMGNGRERLLRAIADTGSSKRLRNLVNAYYRYSEFMFHVPVLFAVGTSLKSLSLAERLKSAGVREQTHKKHRDLDIAVGLALKGYLLKGAEFGLGSCILTAPLIFIEEPEKILSLDKMEIKCFITTGYPDETPSYLQRKDITEIYREI